MKRIKLTFWILGFGCGMIVAGMLGILLSINVSVESESNEVTISTPKIETDRLTEENAETGETEAIEKEDAQVLEESVNKSKENIKEAEVENANVSSNNQMEQVRTITIPSNISASEVCKLLEKNGIINDAADFLAYIKEMKQQTSIRSGEYTLPVGASYDQLLSALI